MLKLKNHLRQRLHTSLGLDIPYSTWFSGIYHGRVKKTGGAIYMLHRVADPDPTRLFSNENLKVSAAFLDRFISGLKSRKVELVSMDEVHQRLSSGTKSNGPYAAFTLDDGYRDNYEQAAPVFRKHRVPYTIYVSTSIPDKSAFLWWFALEDLVLENEVLKLADGETLPCATREEKERAFLNLRIRLLNLSQETLEEEMTRLLGPGLPIANVSESMGMNWPQLEELSQDPLCTIGGHTIRHLSLATLSKEKVMEEVVGGMDRLQAMLKRPVRHFAYPFGSRKEVGQREIDLLRTTGVLTSCVGYGGALGQVGHDLMELPRVYLSEKFS